VPGWARAQAAVAASTVYPTNNFQDSNVQDPGSMVHVQAVFSSLQLSSVRPLWLPFVASKHANKYLAIALN
jgi:hypothetical protein